MDRVSASPSLVPPQDVAVPGSYAIAVTAQQIHVFQFRISPVDQDGSWHHHETLDRDDNPKLTLEYATFATGEPGSNWVFAESYDCNLDCE